MTLIRNEMLQQCLICTPQQLWTDWTGYLLKFRTAQYSQRQITYVLLCIVYFVIAKYIWECEFKKLLELSISEDEEGIDTTWTHLPMSVATRLSSSLSSISDDIGQIEQSRLIHQNLFYRLSNIKLLQKMSNDSIRYNLVTLFLEEKQKILS